MLTKTILATTAMVLCASTCFAGQETIQVSDTAIRTTGMPAPIGTRFNMVNRSANAQFASWYGKARQVAPRNGETLLYEQSASSEFAQSAIPSWQNDSAYGGYSPSGTLAADDFTIPGTGRRAITAVYAAGTHNSEQSFANVIFFSNLRYNKTTGTTTAVVKAECPGMPITDTGTGLMVDVSSCNSGTFRAGHDYGVSVQAESAGGAWYWQTNRKRIGRPGFFYDYRGGGSGSCYQQLTPIKTCFPTKGYGHDLAFAIYGN